MIFAIVSGLAFCNTWLVLSDDIRPMTLASTWADTNGSVKNGSAASN